MKNMNENSTRRSDRERLKNSFKDRFRQEISDYVADIDEDISLSGRSSSASNYSSTKRNNYSGNFSTSPFREKKSIRRSNLSRGYQENGTLMNYSGYEDESPNLGSIVPLDDDDFTNVGFPMMDDSSESSQASRNNFDIPKKRVRSKSPNTRFTLKRPRAKQIPRSKSPSAFAWRPTREVNKTENFQNGEMDQDKHYSSNYLNSYNYNKYKITGNNSSETSPNTSPKLKQSNNYYDPKNYIEQDDSSPYTSNQDNYNVDSNSSNTQFNSSINSNSYYIESHQSYFKEEQSKPHSALSNYQTKVKKNVYQSKLMNNKNTENYSNALASEDQIRSPPSPGRFKSKIPSRSPSPPKHLRGLEIDEPLESQNKKPKKKTVKKVFKHADQKNQNNTVDPISPKENKFDYNSHNSLNYQSNDSNSPKQNSPKQNSPRKSRIPSPRKSLQKENASPSKFKKSPQADKYSPVRDEYSPQQKISPPKENYYTQKFNSSPQRNSLSNKHSYEHFVSPQTISETNISDMKKDTNSENLSILLSPGRISPLNMPTQGKTSPHLYNTVNLNISPTKNYTVNNTNQFSNTYAKVNITNYNDNNNEGESLISFSPVEETNNKTQDFLSTMFSTPVNRGNLNGMNTLVDDLIDFTDFTTSQQKSKGGLITPPHQNQFENLINRNISTSPPFSIVDIPFIDTTNGENNKIENPIPILQINSDKSSDKNSDVIYQLNSAGELTPLVLDSTSSVVSNPQPHVYKERNAQSKQVKTEIMSCINIEKIDGVIEIEKDEECIDIKLNQHESNHENPDSFHSEDSYPGIKEIVTNDNANSNNSNILIISEGTTSNQADYSSNTSQSSPKQITSFSSDVKNNSQEITYIDLNEEDDDIVKEVLLEISQESIHSNTEVTSNNQESTTLPENEQLSENQEEIESDNSSHYSAADSLLPVEDDDFLNDLSDKLFEKDNDISIPELQEPELYNKPEPEAIQNLSFNEETEYEFHEEEGSENEQSSPQKQILIYTDESNSPEKLKNTVIVQMSSSMNLDDYSNYESQSFFVQEEPVNINNRLCQSSHNEKNNDSYETDDSFNANNSNSSIFNDDKKRERNNSSRSQNNTDNDETFMKFNHEDDVNLSWKEEENTSNKYFDKNHENGEIHMINNHEIKLQKTFEEKVSDEIASVNNNKIINDKDLTRYSYKDCNKKVGFNESSHDDVEEDIIGDIEKEIHDNKKDNNEEEEEDIHDHFVKETNYYYKPEANDNMDEELNDYMEEDINDMEEELNDNMEDEDFHDDIEEGITDLEEDINDMEEDINDNIDEEDIYDDNEEEDNYGIKTNENMEEQFNDDIKENINNQKFDGYKVRRNDDADKEFVPKVDMQELSNSIYTRIFTNKLIKSLVLSITNVPEIPEKPPLKNYIGDETEDIIFAFQERMCSVIEVDVITKNNKSISLFPMDLNNYIKNGKCILLKDEENDDRNNGKGSKGPKKFNLRRPVSKKVINSKGNIGIHHNNKDIKYDDQMNNNATETELDVSSDTITHETSNLKDESNMQEIHPLSNINENSQMKEMTKDYNAYIIHHNKTEDTIKEEHDNSKEAPDINKNINKKTRPSLKSPTKLKKKNEKQEFRLVKLAGIRQSPTKTVSEEEPIQENPIKQKSKIHRIIHNNETHKKPIKDLESEESEKDTSINTLENTITPIKSKIIDKKIANKDTGKKLPQRKSPITRPPKVEEIDYKSNEPDNSNNDTLNSNIPSRRKKSPSRSLYDSALNKKEINEIDKQVKNENNLKDQKKGKNKFSQKTKIPPPRKSSIKFVPDKTQLTSLSTPPKGISHSQDSPSFSTKNIDSNTNNESPILSPSNNLLDENQNSGYESPGIALNLSPSSDKISASSSPVHESSIPTPNNSLSKKNKQHHSIGMPNSRLYSEPEHTTTPNRTVSYSQNSSVKKSNNKNITSSKISTSFRSSQNPADLSQEVKIGNNNPSSKEIKIEKKNANLKININSMPKSTGTTTTSSPQKSPPRIQSRDTIEKPSKLSAALVDINDENGIFIDPDINEDGLNSNSSDAHSESKMIKPTSFSFKCNSNNNDDKAVKPSSVIIETKSMKKNQAKTPKVSLNQGSTGLKFSNKPHSALKKDARIEQINQNTSSSSSISSLSSNIKKSMNPIKSKGKITSQPPKEVPDNSQKEMLNLNESNSKQNETSSRRSAAKTKPHFSLKKPVKKSNKK
ncbi:hypothetical protein TRFO_20297 [Tritrichomonas foetus]|uniref:Uncharacterized protein n=1 Tax=Tritrichomonas foetus TaxID=1144522 RepID=A0A1J4KG93_9EUKA|nr:hypothetical protein TRFO_20297 [Tritrichomonas foetus]|eukprot:OHT10417.1 hypothetical protein TRFO_20297 [Tritrichomonas foetus]